MADLHRITTVLGMMKRLKGMPIEDPQKLIDYYIFDVESLVSELLAARVEIERLEEQLYPVNPAPDP